MAVNAMKCMQPLCIRRRLYFARKRYGWRLNHCSVINVARSGGVMKTSMKAVLPSACDGGLIVAESFLASMGAKYMARAIGARREIVMSRVKVKKHLGKRPWALSACLWRQQGEQAGGRRRAFSVVA